MLQTLLARGRLMVGLGTNLDPSVDIKHSGERGQGCRPTIFFGPQRDALSLITKQIHTSIILRPKKLKDFETKVFVLGFPAGDPETKGLWNTITEKAGDQIFPQTKVLELSATASSLDSKADVYIQNFAVENCSEDWMKELSLKVESYIWDDCYRERFHITGADDFDCWLVNWHKPEIGAGHLLQSTHVNEAQSSITSFRGPVFFTIKGLVSDKQAPLAFAECGWNQQGHFARDRFENLIEGVTQRDDVKGYFYGAQSKADSSWLPLESKSMDAIGQTDGLIAWAWNGQENFEIQYQITDNLDEAVKASEESFSASLEKTIASDHQWLSTKKPAPSYLNDKAKAIYNRTLLTLKQMVDPDGGIIAAPEFHYPFTHCGGYGYCWGRDAGFISYAMDVCGMHEESARFYRYMAKCQSEDGSFLHRHDMDGNLGSSWGHLQPDETGSVVFGVWQHVKLSDNKDLANELRPMVDKATNWLATAKHSTDPELPIEGHDLWEERVGVHYYAVGAMAAGIKAAIDLYKYMDWEAPESWSQELGKLIDLTHSDRFIQEGDGKVLFARTLLRHLDGSTALKMQTLGAKVDTSLKENGRQEYKLERDFVGDISQLGAGYPYEVFNFEEKGDAWDQLIDVTFEQLWRKGAGGVGRYEADYYRDGNPWILATLWLALAADQRGKTDIAKKCWQWSYEHASPEGLLAEQIDPKTGKPAWVMPLTWSHAMFGLAVHQLKEEVVK